MTGVGSHFGLRARIEAKEFVTAIGAHDALTARQVEVTGFDAVYVGSYSTEAAALAVPDLSLMSRDERLDIARHVVNAVSVPVIVDIEEGYGNAVAVAAAVRDFEAAGVSAVHLDDEVMPGKCPMLPRIPPNRLIDVAEMQGKIAAAVEARRSSDTLIIARSDVVATMDRTSYRTEGGVAEVIDRSNAYLAAGADVIFVMAFDEEDLRLYRREIAGPLVGVFAPAEPLPIKAFRDAGFEMTIGSLVSLYASIRGVAAALTRLRDTEDWNALSDLIATDAEFYELVGLEAVAEQFRKYGVR